MTDPIRVFVGTEAKTEIARKVLEHSIRRHTQADVQFVPMIGPEWEYDITGIKVGTGFSLRRWMIPAYCDWEGRALYVDADIICFADIADLWRLPDVRRVDNTVNPVLWATFQTDKWSPKRPVPQTSVMVIDCERARGFSGFHLSSVLDDLRASPTKEHYGSVMHASWLPENRVAHVGVEWNALNVCKPGVTKLLHFTAESSQPWYKPDHPHAGLWKSELIKALEAGVVTRDDMQEALDNWGKKEDWRPTNGLHPVYRKFLVSACA